MPNEIKTSQQAWLNNLIERINWFGWILLKEKNRLKINTRLNNKTAERDKKFDLAIIAVPVDKTFKVSKEIRAGVIWANTFNKFDPASPFGGYKESGVGS